MGFARQARALASAPTSQSAPATVSADMLLDWVEYKLPDLVPKASATKFPSVVFDGVNFNIRAYNGSWGTRYLGVAADGRFFALGDFTGGELRQFNDIAFWSAQVLSDQCAMNPASCANVTPVAVAGVAQSIAVGAVVTLNGSTSSDANGDPLTFAWTLVSRPAGSAAVLSGATTARPTFTADRAGSYTASLVVSDGKASSLPAQVVVTAAAANAAPVANAGPTQYVYTGSVTTLDGRGSADANGDPLTYSWTLTSRPAGSSAGLFGATGARPTFTPDIAGTYVASLTVSDGRLSSLASAVTVIATTPPPPPTVVQGLLFGGFNNSVYLGCLTCNRFDLESVCNQFGTYGSEFALNGIWNQFGTYGSQFNSYSPWNQFSTSGPSIIGTDGQFYGYFTTNRFQFNRTQAPAFVSILNYYLNTGNLAATRAFTCGS